jgi:predicted ribosomally synthesized peptide with SipW-like signal peptide
MKNLIIVIAVAAVALLSGGATDAAFGDESTQQGTISAGRLQEMGLGGIASISDRQAMDVRGSGFVVVFGKSYARGGGSDSYFKIRRNVAYGSSWSHGSRTWSGGFAGGFAW